MKRSHLRVKGNTIQYSEDTFCIWEHLITLDNEKQCKEWITAYEVIDSCVKNILNDESIEDPLSSLRIFYDPR